MSDPFDKLRNFDAGVGSPDPQQIRARANQIKARRYQAMGAMAAILIVSTAAFLFRPTTGSKIAIRSPAPTAQPSPSPESVTDPEGQTRLGQAPAPATPAPSQKRAASESSAALAPSQSDQPGLRVELELSHETASPSNPVTLRLSVCNDQPTETTLQFNTSQRYDFEVLRQDGSVAWRWSADMQFLQATGSETFQPGCRTIGQEAWNGDPHPPGTYQARGRLTSNPPFESATKKICVRACS